MAGALSEFVDKGKLEGTRLLMVDWCAGKRRSLFLSMNLFRFRSLVLASSETPR